MNKTIFVANVGAGTSGGARVKSTYPPRTAAGGNSVAAPGLNRSTTLGSGIVTATGGRPAVGAGIGVGASANAGGGQGVGIVTGQGIQPRFRAAPAAR
jgi:hypothetical protein